MSASNGFALSSCMRRFADLVPSGARYVGEVPAQDERAAEFNIAMLGATIDVFGSASRSAGTGVAVLGRRRRGAGGCTPYRFAAAEALIAHRGRWRVSLGTDGESGSVEIDAGDVMSVPAGEVRRLELLDDVSGFLFVVRGVEETGGLAAAPAVCAADRAAGLGAIRGGPWIDDSAGVPVLRSLRAGDSMLVDATPGAGDLGGCVCRADAMHSNPRSPFSSDDVGEAPIVVPKATADGFLAGPLGGRWPHGFNLRLLTLASGAYVPAYRRLDALAFLVQDGTVEVHAGAESVVLGAGDTLSLSAGREHALRNSSSRSAQVIVVVGSEDPAGPDFASRPLRGG